jgi:outer membrane receptor protein involved in Fe transport
MSLQLGAQSARGKSLESGEALDDVPADSLNLQWRKTVLEHGYLQVRSAAFARDERPGPTETIYPGYGIIDLGGGWEFSPRISLEFKLRNLLDKDYPLSPDPRAVASPGRSALLTLTVSPFAR